MIEHSERDNDRERMLSKTERYSALPEKTRTFIENLHDDDLTILADFIRLGRAKGMPKLGALVDMADGVSTMARWSRWVILTGSALFVAVTGVVTAWSTFWAGRGGHQ